MLLCFWLVQEGCTHQYCSPRADARVASSQLSPWTKASPASLVILEGEEDGHISIPSSVCLSVESLSFQVKAPSSKPYPVSPSEPPTGSCCCPGGAGLQLSKRRGPSLFAFGDKPLAECWNLKALDTAMECLSLVYKMYIGNIYMDTLYIRFLFHELPCVCYLQPRR